MYCHRFFYFIFFIIFYFTSEIKGQDDTLIIKYDSVNETLLDVYKKQLSEYEEYRKNDSLKKAELQEQLSNLKKADVSQKESLLQQLKNIEVVEKKRTANRIAHIDSIRKTAIGYPVIGIMEDTLFFVYSKIGPVKPKERAKNITQKIKRIYDDDFYNKDSLSIVNSGYLIDCVYKDLIVMSVSEDDAIFYNMEQKKLALDFNNKIVKSLKIAKEQKGIFRILLRIGLAVIVIVLAWGIIVLIGKGSVKLLKFIISKENTWLKDLSYKDYTFLTTKQELSFILFFIKIFKWVIYIILLYITLPILFSIFPFSRTWADALLGMIWTPVKSIFMAVYDYLPNLFSILITYFVIRYVARLVKYFFKEIELEKLKIIGFHTDWAMPTYSIVRFLLYAFMFVLIFPKLPGSDSEVFKGVSVFIGLLVSLGSSSVIANIVAGLVITYMRPFKIGDRIKIGDSAGDVIEKTLLVTRVRTIKNEVITIPNASVLTGNTTNYTSEAMDKGLVVYTSITIGYDVPWKNVHEALKDAALKTQYILIEPEPFVLQTSLDDFFVSYQINAYTREASKQAVIYSFLHQNIQDVFNERGIEILSPHYRATRDGNETTVPKEYLPDDYKVPSFRINLDKEV